LRKQFLLALRQPALLANHDQGAWQHLLALGRLHAVSGRWHAQLEALDWLPQVPTPDHAADALAAAICHAAHVPALAGTR
jgi:hypothetical protein